MKRWKDPFPQTPKGFHDRVEQTLGGLEDTDMGNKHIYRKLNVALVAALVALLATAAVAVAIVLGNARFKQALTEADCAALLRTEKRGTLALIGDGGYPYAVPINFYYDEAARKIYFHTAKSGHKIDAMQTCDKVCFTVHDAGEQRGDWSYYVKSVIVFGHVQPVTDPAVKYEKAKAFGMKYYPSEEALDRELERDFDRMQIMEITVAHMTGKLVHEQ